MNLATNSFVLVLAPSWYGKRKCNVSNTNVLYFLKEINRSECLKMFFFMITDI